MYDVIAETVTPFKVGRRTEFEMPVSNWERAQ